MSHRLQLCLGVLPVVSALGVLGALGLDSTREATRALLVENGPIELGTFAACLLAFVLALRAVRGRRRDLSRLERTVLLLLGTGLLVVGFEEVAWGQWLLGFQTPEVFAEHNLQGELTLHNLPWLHGRSELMKIAFAATGLGAMFALRGGRWRALRPELFLAPWFLTILLFTLPDLASDYAAERTFLLYAFDLLSEHIELLVCASTCLYLWRVNRPHPLRPGHR